MAGKKRTRNGEIKPSDVTTFGTALESPSSKTTTTTTTTTAENKSSTHPNSTSPEPSLKPTKPIQHKPHLPRHPNRQKLPKLPSNATISKRPLLHPALPSPFASASAPKVLYITATTPYIPCLKRIRKLLSEISRRTKQSLTAQAKRARRRPAANGRLAPQDVEREIAEAAAAERKGGVGDEVGKGEAVYLKATGRAIPRALELGVHFQGEADCWVRVEMGSVCAVDDVEVQGDEGKDVPETRTRMLSSVTVSIGLR